MDLKRGSISMKSRTGSATNGKDSTQRSRVTEALDVAAKLIGAGAVVFTAFIANNFQSNMTATSLLNQREQAESALRGNMFHDLIGPIIGAEKDGADIPPDREQLLVELLALNFHEHFELEPLMSHVDQRLERNNRESLRSIARRVRERQFATLTKREDGLSPTQQAYIYNVDVNLPEKEKKSQLPRTLNIHFEELTEIKSPSGIYTLTFKIFRPDWSNQTFRVLFSVTDKPMVRPPGSPLQTTNKAGEDDSEVVYLYREFFLTWFDFPLTDNTLLADGTRFSLVIDEVNPEDKWAKFKLLWFPQDYFAPQERPTNYHQMHEKLGLTLWNH